MGPLILTVTLVHSEPPWRGSLLSCGRLSCDSLAWMLCGASDPIVVLWSKLGPSWMVNRLEGIHAHKDSIRWMTIPHESHVLTVHMFIGAS